MVFRPGKEHDFELGFAKVEESAEGEVADQVTMAVFDSV